MQTIIDYQLPVEEEYQDWILTGVHLLAVWIFCIPCWCGGLGFSCARKCSNHIRHNMCAYYCCSGLINIIIVLLFVQWLPAYHLPNYFKRGISSVIWFATMCMGMAQSLLYVAAALLAILFKERIFILLGMENANFLRFKIRDLLTCWSTAYQKPMVLTIWKAEDLRTANIFGANHVFADFKYGYNEDRRTRVHNNAGNSCVFKERMQFNFDPTDSTESAIITLRSQQAMGNSANLGEVRISLQYMQELEKKSRESGGEPFQWTEEEFSRLKLNPSGEVWVHVVPLEEDKNSCRTCPADFP